MPPPQIKLHKSNLLFSSLDSLLVGLFSNNHRPLNSFLDILHDMAIVKHHVWLISGCEGKEHEFSVVIFSLFEGTVGEAGMAESMALVLEPLAVIRQTVCSFADTETMASVGEPFAGVDLHGIVRDEIQFKLNGLYRRVQPIEYLGVDNNNSWPLLTITKETLRITSRCVTNSLKNMGVFR